MVASIGLEANFVLQGYIVAEKEDVQTPVEGIHASGAA